MPDRPQASEPAFVPFDKKVPLVGIDPDDTSDTTWVCFNSAWLPYVLGVIGALTRVEIWDTEDFSLRNLEAQRADLLLHMFMEGCSMPQFQLRACTLDCGIEYSTDGGDTWTCISLESCINDLAAAAAADAISNALAFGIIVNPSQPAPSGDIADGDCKTFNVTLRANDRWHCPIAIGHGYTIIIHDDQGGWFDGELLAGTWSCPNGDLYLLGGCVDCTCVADEADPLQTAKHMQIVGNYDDVWFDPFNEWTVVTYNPGDLFFQANDSQLPDNQGEVRFVVEICNPAAIAGCYEYDFTGEEHGWTVYGFNDSTLFGNSWSDGEGYPSVLYATNQWAVIRQTNADLNGVTWDSMEVDVYNPGGTDITDFNFGIYDNSKVAMYGSGYLTVHPGENTLSIPYSETWGNSQQWNIFASNNQAFTIRRWRFLGCNVQPVNSGACA